MNFQLFCIFFKQEKHAAKYIFVSRREEILIFRLPLSSDLAKRIVGKIKKTMYHESRSRILARFQVLLKKKHPINIAASPSLSLSLFFSLFQLTTFYAHFYHINTMYPKKRETLFARRELRLSCTEKSAANVNNTEKLDGENKIFMSLLMCIWKRTRSLT